MAITDTTGHPWAAAAARYHGADTAMSAVSWVCMSSRDAASLLSDVDPEVLDRYPEPNLSGEWADDLTPDSLAEELGLPSPAERELELYDAVADAWEEGRDLVWSDALQAVALRVLGHTDQAMRMERDLERTVAQLRTYSEQHDWADVA